MTDKYYYLVASLPYLDFEKTTPISTKDFLSECSKWVDQEDLSKLISIDVNDIETKPDDTDLIKEWKTFNLDFRTELARIREARLNNLNEKIPPYFLDIFNKPTPLLMEKEIEKKRWSFIEELEFGHHFDIGRLMIYLLKLRIKERLDAFMKERGIEIFNKLCEVTYA